MAKRLVINLDKCDQCLNCKVNCSYFYRPHADDHGVFELREMAAFLVTCRRCEDPSCVAACKFDAIERQEIGVMKRYNLRCVNCKCCAHACPFGTIYPELLTFYVTHCDFCIGAGLAEPSCVNTCDNGALEFREVEEGETEELHLIGDHLAIIGRKWDKQNSEPKAIEGTACMTGSAK